MYKRQHWNPTPWVALKSRQCFRLCTHCNPLCKTSAHRVYPDDTTSVFVVTFVTLVPKPVAGTALYFLWALYECKDCMVLCTCVHRRVIEGLQQKKRVSVCARKKCGINQGTCAVSYSLLFIAPLNPLSLITFLSLYKPVTITNHHKGVWVYRRHDSQTSALRLKAKTIRFFPIKPLNPPIASFSVTIHFLQVWSEVVTFVWVAKIFFMPGQILSLAIVWHLGAPTVPWKLGWHPWNPCFLFVTEIDNSLNSGLSDAFSVTLHFDSLMFTLSSTQMSGDEKSMSNKV